MKNIFVAMLTLTIVAFGVLSSNAGEAEFHGALIGAGSGAALGHAIGGTPEAAVIGSALGGAIGVAIGHGHRYGFPLPPPHIFPPPFPPHPRYWKRSKGYPGHDDRYDRRGERHVRSHPECRIVTKHTYRHGRPYTVTKRICPDYIDRGHRYGRGQRNGSVGYRYN